MSINRHFDEFIVALSKYRPVTILVCAWFMQIGAMYVISTFIFPAHPGGFQYSSVKEHFITAVIAAPIIESYIFQRGIINFSILTIKVSKPVAVLLSAAAFGVTHTYSIAYVVVTFVIGILYGTIYLSFIEKKVNAFWLLVIIHASYNLYGFIMNCFILNNN